MADDDYQAVLDAALHREIDSPPVEEDYRGDYTSYDRAMVAYLVHKRRATRELSSRLPRTPLNMIGKRSLNGKDH